MSDPQGASGEVTLLAVGDIGTAPEPQARFVTPVTDLLAAADIRFAQCERSFSRRGTPPGWGRNGTGEGNGDHTRLDPDLAQIWSSLGVDVLSLASNHTRDWGPDALVDTLDLFHDMGIETIGAGISDAEARQPAIITRSDVSVAFLGYASVIRNGEQAGPGRPGLAPVRARTSYEPIDYQPGCPPRIHTVAYDEDVRAMVEDVKLARRTADVVVVSFHWGVHLLPKVIADYQPAVAHACIDAGADLILGHHTHLINAVEVYRGKVCFYGIGNFIATGTGKGTMHPNYYNLYWYPPDEDGVSVSRDYPFPRDSHMAIAVDATLSQRGIGEVAFRPIWIDGHAVPEVLTEDDERFHQVVRYTEWVSDQFQSNFRVAHGKVVVSTT